MKRLRRAPAILRAQGVRGLWFAVLARTVYRRLVLLERPIEADVPRVDTDVPVEFGELTTPQPAELAGTVPAIGHDEVVRRLDQGHRCFVARLDRRIVTARWVAHHHAPVTYLGCTLRLPEGAAYVYDSYTVPDLRGRNLAGALGTYMVARLREAGTRHLVAAVLPENRPGFGPTDKLGYRAVGTLATVRVGRWRRVVATGQARQLAAYCG